MLFKLTGSISKKQTLHWQSVEVTSKLFISGENQELTLIQLLFAKGIKSFNLLGRKHTLETWTMPLPN